MNLIHLQKIADKVCDHFGIKRIEIAWNERFSWTIGVYRGNKIEIRAKPPYIDTLLHELAHYFKDERYRLKIPGFFKIVKFGGTEILVKIGTSHDKLFKQCFKEIKDFHYGIAKRRKS